ncbi:hypothetical protein B0H34DRAFT_720620 [Crassisporium funariophilum]|nr:hypothetical protein B0H34DRAFT_720620 [Crassisporium funariophilum]
MTSLCIQNKALCWSLHQAKRQVHAWDLVIEGAHSQLLYQNLHLQKTTNVLYNKENRKKNGRALLFDGNAQSLSLDEFYAKILAKNAARDTAAAMRVRNGEMRTARKDSLAALEKEWGRIRLDHENNVKTWETECQKWASDGVPKRQWPKKPVRQIKIKPKLSPTLESGEGIEEENIEEDGEEDD